MCDLTLLEDRERIAMDLQDTVIQQLFATGLSLQSTVRLVHDPGAARRIETADDELDRTIRQIRSTIFAIGPDLRAPLTGTCDRVLTVVAEAVRPLGSEPRVEFDGPVDTAVSDDEAEELVAALRKALTNVARHVRATDVRVKVVAETDDVVLRVADNGVGVATASSPSGGRGLANQPCGRSAWAVRSSYDPARRAARPLNGACRVITERRTRPGFTTDLTPIGGVRVNQPVPEVRRRGQGDRPVR